MESINIALYRIQSMNKNKICAVNPKLLGQPQHDDNDDERLVFHILKTRNSHVNLY